MSLVLKPDGFTDTVNDSPQTMLLWVTTTSGSAGDWIAEYTSDTSNPGGVTGESYRTADADNADAAILLAQRVVAQGVPSEVLTDASLREVFGFTQPH